MPIRNRAWIRSPHSRKSTKTINLDPLRPSRTRMDHVKDKPANWSYWFRKGILFLLWNLVVTRAVLPLDKNGIVLYFCQTAALHVWQTNLKVFIDKIATEHSKYLHPTCSAVVLQCWRFFCESTGLFSVSFALNSRSLVSRNRTSLLLWIGI